MNGSIVCISSSSSKDNYVVSETVIDSRVIISVFTNQKKRMLSLKKAKELSILKWTLHVKHDGEYLSLDDEPLLKDLLHNCGFCERHHRKGTNGWTDCENCEFAKVTHGDCMTNSNIYLQWVDNSTIANAKKILRAIKSIKTDDDEKIKS